MEQLLLSLSKHPVFQSYLFYISILTIKMMLMALLTIRQRLHNKAFVSEEDAVFLKGKVGRYNEKVERVRRGHLNDIESIYLFAIIGLAYVFTKPEPKFANKLYMFYTISRIIHTFVYTIVVVPQPARGTTWLLGFLITGYMGVKTFLQFC